MDFVSYQKLAVRTAKSLGETGDLVHSALGIAGESGEYVDCVKKHVVYGRQLDAINAAEELGDLLWFIALGCQALGVSMSEIAQQNIDKLRIRYPDKYTDDLSAARLDKEHKSLTLPEMQK